MQNITDCIEFLLSRSLQKANQISKSLLTPFDITPPQYTVLHVLWEKDGVSASDLSSRLHIDAATLTGMLDRLEQKTLIRRMPDPADRRVNCIFLTEPGKALQESLSGTVEFVNERTLQGLSLDEIQTLKQLLTKVYKP